jgi:Predicted pPIWI-associating nuclease
VFPLSFCNTAREINRTRNLLPQTNVLQTVAAQAALGQKLLPEISVLQKIIQQINMTKDLSASINPESIQIIRNTSALWASYTSLSRLSLTNIGSALHIDGTLKTVLGSDFLAFSNSYFALSQSFERADLESHIASAMPVFALPEVELFNSADLLEVITIQEAGQEVEKEEVEVKQHLKDEITTQTTEALEVLLTALDTNLVRLWQGANQTLLSDNVDRSRHFLISLRELFTQVLHQLAPDDEVSKWTTSPEHFVNGRPIRRARLLFICRGINYAPFNSFVEKDITSMLSVCDLFNRAHEVTILLTQEQLVALKIRVESALRLLLTTGQSSK